MIPIVSLLERRLTKRWWVEERRRSRRSVQSSIRQVLGHQSVEDGVGAPLRRRYEISLRGGRIAPADVLDQFRTNPNDFAPSEYAWFDGDGLGLDARSEVKLAGPWNGPVHVVISDPLRIRLATLEGHMEAGWIDFLVVDDPEPTFVIESLARAGDRGFWLVHELIPIGRWIQADMWASVLESAATVAQVPGGPGRVRISTVKLDDESDAFHWS